MAMLAVCVFRLKGQDSNVIPQPAPTFEEFPDARAALISALQAAKPMPAAKQSRTFVTSDGRKVFFGDLFHNGVLCAVVELPHELEADNSIPAVGFAIWTGKEWEPRSLWKINPTWRPKGWKNDEGDYFPIRPVEEPFRMLEIASGKPPLLVVAGDVFKYFQEYNLAKYDPHLRDLVFVSESKDVEVIGGYVRTRGDSGHRALYQFWDFYRWNGVDLIPVAHWYEGEDDSFSGEDREESFIIKADAYDKAGKKTASYRDDLGTITRDGRQYGKVDFEWKKPGPGKDDEREMLEQAYIFEKLTGVPRKLYPVLEGKADPSALERLTKITVTGTPEAIKQLSSAKKFKWPF